MTAVLRDDEADRFRWIESASAGCGPNEYAARAWATLYPPAAVRKRVLDHLLGKLFWIELRRNEFGLLMREFPGKQELVQEIATQLAGGADNLTVLTWAVETAQPIDTVTEILSLIDINRFHNFNPFADEQTDDDSDPPFIVQG